MTGVQSDPASIKTASILGVPIALVDLETAVQTIETFLEGTHPKLVVTANAIAAVLAYEDREFQQLLQGAGLVTADGAGIQWALRRRGLGRWPKVTGVDILEKLCQKSAEQGYRLFFLGGAPGVADEAAERLRLRFPGCNIVGTRHGFFPASDDDLVAEEVGATNPDIVFVAMGMPRQEKFFTTQSGRLKAKVGVGVGGSFDVFSGRVKRAPKFWQTMHLEWLWRALQNPTKIKNLRNLPRFVLLELKSK